MTRGKRTKVSVGDVFNRWTVKSDPYEKSFPSGSKALFVVCDCLCGTVDREVRLAQLTSTTKQSRSCGCLKTEVAKQKRELPVVGAVFGRLEIIEDLGQIQGKSRTYNKVLVKCSCGSEPFPVSYNGIKSGHTSSCGCFNKERISETFKTHGKSKSKIYKVWLGIKDRSDNPNNSQFHDYGGRGIRNLWESFEQFLEVMEDTYFEGCEVDRIDVNGHYSPENCRWTTRSVNTHNKRKRKGCTSDFIGVHIDPNTNKFVASITKDGEEFLRESFIDELQAAIAYDDASEILYGDRPNKTLKGAIP
jgi:hypothetical protein